MRQATSLGVGMIALGSLLGLGPSCGAAAPKPASPDAAVVPKPSADPIDKAPLPGPIELPAVVRALPEQAAFYAYVDGDRLSASPLVAAYTAAMEKVGSDPLAEARKKCGFDPVEAVKDAAVAGRVVPGAKQAVVGVISIDRGPVVAMECLKKLGAKPSSTAGLELGEGMVAVQAGDYVVVGEPSAVSLAAARAGREGRGPERLRVALERHPEAALVAVGNLGERIQESGFGWSTLTVTSTPGRFSARVEIETPDPTTAKAYATAFDPGAVMKDLPLIRTWSEGNRMLAELSVEGGPTEQAFRLGVAAALAVNGVKKYIASSKTSEAKHNVGRLARELASEVEAKPAGKRRFPRSAPPTPAKPPSGTKTALGPDAWKHPTWKALGFAPEEPLYYSYQIITAPDGKRAEVRASGDLDGDGALSRFSLRLRIEKSGDVTVEPLDIADELE